MNKRSLTILTILFGLFHITNATVLHVGAGQPYANLESAASAVNPGDTIRVHVKIREGEKERLQAFEGTVIARKNTGMGQSITVRTS